MTYLFVYGTLMRKCEPNSWSNFLQENAEFIGEARIRGELYQIAYYPGLVKGQNWVFGEVYLLKNIEKVIPFLDEYEDFSPDNPKDSLYVREICEVELIEKSNKLNCWTYLYNRETDKLKKYPDGRFS